MSFENSDLDVVREFLSTAVFIDDQLGFVSDANAEDSPPGEADEIEAPGEFDGTSHSKATADPARKLESQKIDAQKIIEGFAEQGLVCGVYKFDKSFTAEPERSRLLAAVSKADLITLDWKLLEEKEVGKTAAELFASLLEMDVKRRPRLRMCAVYSSLGAKPILEQLAVRLSSVDHLMVKENSEQASLCIKTEKGELLWRIFVINKSHVEEDALAKMIIGKFSDMVDGFMPELVMAAVSETRRRTYEYLYLFPGSLDGPAFDHFLHLYSLKRTHPTAVADFSDFVIDLINSTIGDSIRGSGLVAAASSRKRIAGRIEKQMDMIVEAGRWNNENGRQKCSDANDNAKAVAYIRAADHDARKKAFEAAFPNSRFETDRHSVGIKDLTPPSHAKLTRRSIANHFPQMMDGRVKLTSGTIVKIVKDKVAQSANKGPDHSQVEVSSETDEDSCYLLCVQPVCDSVRLSPGNPFAFPFLKLTLGESTKFNLVLFDEKPKFLRYNPKPSSLRVIKFNACSENEDIRSNSSKGDKPRLFVDVNGLLYRFIDQLKPGIAQEVQVRLANNTSRIGSNKHEFHRQADRT